MRENNISPKRFNKSKKYVRKVIKLMIILFFQSIKNLIFKSLKGKYNYLCSMLGGQNEIIDDQL